MLVNAAFMNCGIFYFNSFIEPVGRKYSYFIITKKCIVNIQKFYCKYELF